VDTRTAKLDLTFSFEELRGIDRTLKHEAVTSNMRLTSLTWHCRGDWKQHWCGCLTGCCATLPLINELDILSAEEREQSSRMEQHHACDTLRDAAGAVRTQVKRTPQAPAVVFEHQELTYQNWMNAQTAWLTVSSGRRRPGTFVGCDTTVAGDGDRIGQHSQVGRRYLPLDPEYPKERLRS